MPTGIAKYTNKKTKKTMYTASIGMNGETVNLGRRTSKAAAQRSYDAAKKMKDEGATAQEIWLKLVGPLNKPKEE